VALEEAPATEGDPGTIVAGWESAFLESHYKFLLIDLLPGVRYTTLVRACFAAICMPEVRSDGFLTAPTAGTPGQLNASAVLTYPDPDNPREATLDLSIAWDAFAFDQASPPVVFYAWSVSTTGHVSNDIHDWTPYVGTEPYEVSPQSLGVYVRGCGGGGVIQLIYFDARSSAIHEISKVIQHMQQSDIPLAMGEELGSHLLKLCPCCAEKRNNVVLLVLY
jgi:hypothetical protein